VIRLKAHYGTREIAKRTGLSRKIVRRVLKEGGVGVAQPSGARGAASKLAPFRERIKEKVEKGLTVTRIEREIRELGYQGRRTILAKAVRALRVQLPSKAEKAKRRFETGPVQDYVERRVMLSDGHPAASESALRRVHNPRLRIIPMAAWSVRHATARGMHDRPDAREGLPTLVQRRGFA
jgi:transposase